MSIRYAPTNIWQQFVATTQSEIISGVKTKALNANWTLKESVAAYVVLTYTGQPSDTQTATFNGITYVAKNTPSGAHDFQIGGDAKTTYDNLAAEIESDDANLNALNTGAGASGTLKVSWATAGELGNGFAASNGLSNASLDVTAARYGGYKLLSGKTPEGLQCILYVDASVGGATYARLRVSPRDESVFSQDFYLVAAASRTLDFIGCEYQLWIFLLASASADKTEFMCGVPALRSGHAALVISSVANNGGAFEVTTASAHGWVSNQHVFIDGAQGVSGLNGFWQVTVTGTTTAILISSTYAAGYAANSAIAATNRQTSRAIWALGQTGTNTTFRASLGGTAGTNIVGFFAWNQFSYNILNLDASYLSLMEVAGMDITPREVFTTGIYADFMEPRLAWRSTNSGGSFRQIGDLWSSFLVTASAPKDLELLAFDSHNWFQFTDFTRCSLWLAVS